MAGPRSEGSISRPSRIEGSPWSLAPKSDSSAALRDSTSALASDSTARSDDVGPLRFLGLVFSLHVIGRRSGHFPQLTQPRLVLDALRSVVEQALRRDHEAAGDLPVRLPLTA